MAMQSSDTEKGGLPIPLIVAGLVALVVIVAVLAFRAMPRQQITTLADTPNVVWMKQKAKESGGDMNRLSPDDRARFQQISGPAFAEANMKRYAAGQK